MGRREVRALGYRQCARPGCDSHFYPGNPNQRYCEPECAQTARNQSRQAVNLLGRQQLGTLTQAQREATLRAMRRRVETNEQEDRAATIHNDAHRQLSRADVGMSTSAVRLAFDALGESRGEAERQTRAQTLRELEIRRDQNAGSTRLGRVREYDSGDFRHHSG